MTKHSFHLQYICGHHIRARATQKKTARNDNDVIGTLQIQITTSIGGETHIDRGGRVTH